MPTPTSSAWLMADRLTGGTLADKLAAYRRAGVALAAVSRLLRQEYGVHATDKTLAAWCEELDAPETSTLAGASHTANLVHGGGAA